MQRSTRSLHESIEALDQPYVEQNIGDTAFTIQAEVLMCMWPISPPMMIADPTLFLASIIKAGCMQLGLHQPEHMQVYNRIRFRIQNRHIEEAMKLWAACFIVTET